MARVPHDAMAFPQRDAAFDVNINGVWQVPAERDAAVRWTRSLYDAIAPFAHGRAYVNFIGDEGQERVRAAYGPEKHARLVALKDRFDPDNVFRSNHNIRPSR
jgi:FAD/FMN-containing dehydrogenase